MSNCSESLTYRDVYQQLSVAIMQVEQLIAVYVHQ